MWKYLDMARQALVLVYPAAYPGSLRAKVGPALWNVDFTVSWSTQQAKALVEVTQYRWPVIVIAPCHPHATVINHEILDLALQQLLHYQPVFPFPITCDERGKQKLRARLCSRDAIMILLPWLGL